MITGLTGRIASGKGVIAEFLKEKGFEYFTLSNEVREEAKKRGIPIERKTLQDLGNLMREEEGLGVLIKRVIRKMEENKDYVIDGIRNTGEVEELRKAFKENFYLISTDADLELRWRNMQNRGKESDPKTFEGFLEIDKRDAGENLGNGQQVKKCMELADYHILNNSTLEDLYLKITEVYKKIKNTK
jgi:dephospho-CoA kinase